MLKKFFEQKVKQFKKRKNNFLGKIGHYPVCPNCGDSLGFKAAENILIQVSFPHLKSINICCECLEKPDILDAEKIENLLKRFSCNRDDILRIVCAINNYKKGLKLKFPAYFFKKSYYIRKHF